MGALPAARLRPGGCGELRILGVAATEDLYQTTQYLGWRGKSVVGTGRDPQRAEALLLRACALGRDDGCETAVAVGSHDPALRARLEAICGRPDSGGCRALARMLTHDDPSQALAWYAKGCRAEALAKDDPVSDSRRAECCLEVAKRLVPSDAARAIALLDLLCVNEKPWGGRACRILGESYVDGKVVPAQPAKAVEYFRRACRLDPERGPKGDSYSCARAREMRKKRG
ncbi:SEL1-like repeat protein [Haliangium sp. UPWRP_2]|uniref:SEL1-like repeat protein n=1 Tax=Haliangium sp. UPWRP_2 TaxID=1931276 RepID=UPI001304D573|nr:SEL1-like repeat protein [Haliangium sp. UPWRP_2]